ncbi:MAG: site-2 protease family protein [Bifidobacteriaceae bacterium]|jgi:membrane-associated protease RseP (regulator of RpoE activity)|nr:site-2 protease family protein [Bifidobacteriaceae bacterium]
MTTVLLYILGIVVFVVILVVSVGWHELGHLIPAKAFGIKVSQYMIGFGKTIWSRPWRGTEYGVKWIPLGGYIRMAAMYTPHRSKKAPITGWRAQLASEARAASLRELEGLTPDQAFYTLSAPRKCVIMLGGPTMNLILALALTAIAGSGIGYYDTTTTLEAVSPCLTTEGATADDCGEGTLPGPAAGAGLRAGDVITAWNGQATGSWTDVTAAIGEAGEEPSTVTVDRNGQALTFTLTPVKVQDPDLGERSMVGITSHVGLVRQPLADAPKVLWQQVAASAKLYAGLPIGVWNTAVDLVKGNERSLDSPASIVGVARVSGEITTAIDSGLADAWRLRLGTWLQLAASLNIALWLFNLLPLLPLDGGHVANALFEGVRRTAAKARGKPDPGPADSARLMPLTYAVAGLLILMTVVLVLADIFNPVDLG